MRDRSGNSFWNQISTIALVRFLLILACGWGILQVLNYFESIIVIFSFAAIIAFLLSYPVRYLNRFLPYNVAASLVFLLSLLIIICLTLSLGFTILSQGQQLIDGIIASLNSLSPVIIQIEGFLRDRNLQVNLSLIQETLRDRVLAGIGYIVGYLQIFLTNLLTLIIIFVVAFFMLLEGRQLWRFILKILPEHLRLRFTIIVKRKFLGFFRGQLILCLFLTASTFLVFVLLGVQFPLILALIVGIFDTIPGIGATLGISFVSLVLLSQSFWLALKVLAACIVLQQIQDNLISPRVMQNSININPVIVFFALLVGAKVAGLVGVFLSIPIAGVIVSLLDIDEMKKE